LKYIQEKYINLLPLENVTKKYDKYNFRCPICGDSKKNHRKRRGWLLWNPQYNTYTYKCFNCDFSTNLYGFLEAVSPSLLDEYKIETRNEKLKSFNTEKKSHPKKISFEFEIPQEYSPCQNNPDCIKYVKSRGVPFKHYSNWKYSNNNVLIPLEFEDELIGYQTRSITGKFFNITLEGDNDFKIYNYEHEEGTELYFFESIFCATRFDGLFGKDNKQGVSLVGRSVPKELELDILEMKDKAYFVFDNDEAGRLSINKYSKVFPEANFLLWDKKIKQKDFSDVADVIPEEKLEKWFFSSFKNGRTISLINSIK